MANPVFVIARKEFLSLFSEKTLLLAVLVQLFVASFSSLLVLGLASFYDPGALGGYGTVGAEVGIVGYDENLVGFVNTGDVRLHFYPDFQTALDSFDRGKVDAILTIPDGVDAGGSDIIRLTLYLPDSDVKGTLAVLRLKEPLSGFESFVRAKRSHRIEFVPTTLYVPEKPQGSAKYFEFIYGILIPLLVFTPVFISGGLVVDFITEEVEKCTLDVLLASPVSFFSMLGGKILTAVVIVPVQVLTWLFFVKLNGIAVANVWLIGLFSLLLAFMLVFIGAWIALEYPDRSTAQYLYSLALIFLFLLSYVVPGSPLNLISRFSADSIGFGGSLFYLGVYFLFCVILYVPIWFKAGLKKSEDYI